MAVGAGSIKRASKLNAEAETKKVAAETEATATPAVEAAEEKAPAKKTTTRKTTTRKTTTKKTTAAKTAEVKTEEVKEEAAKVQNVIETIAAEMTKPVVEAKVVEAIDPEILNVVLDKKESKTKSCHLTEDMPVYLL